MPTYEYVCTECATPLEVVASFTDPPLTQCPTCNGRLRKVFGNVGVVFKGSGFYRTDNRSKTPSGKAVSTTSEKATGSGSNGSSTTKEPAAATSGSTASGSGSTSTTPAAASAS